MDFYKSGHAQAGENMFGMDMFVLGAVMLTLSANSANSAKKLMIQTWNLVAAQSLLRTHIDTALRFSAASLVEDHEAFAADVLGGKQIDHKGQHRRTDARQVSYQ
jgi:hypothetical protein